MRLTCSFEHAALSKTVFLIQGCPDKDRMVTSNFRHTSQKTWVITSSKLLFPLLGTEWAARVGNPVLCIYSSRSGCNIWENVLEAVGVKTSFLSSWHFRATHGRPQSRQRPQMNCSSLEVEH